MFAVFVACVNHFAVKAIRSQQMSKKIEVKKAEDIEQRLDEVKGIDEIKDEISNIIKII